MTNLLLCLSLVAAVALPPTAQQQPTLEGTWRARLQDSWNRDGRQWISIQLQQDSDGSRGFSIPMDELEGLGARGDRWTASGVQVQHAA